MRIWHKKLHHDLCRNHLLGAWREIWGAWKIITENKKGYSNHPAVKEYADSPLDLWEIMKSIRAEMLSRDYNPKELPEKPNKKGEINEWQSLEKQKSVLRNKGCDCRI